MPLGAFRQSLNLAGAIAAPPAPSENYWVTFLRRSDGNTAHFIYGVDTNTAGEILFAGAYADTTITTASFVGKLSNEGALLWHRYLNTSGNDDYRAISLDSSNNIYCAGRQNSADGLISKYNTSGTIQWQRRQAGASTDQMYGLVTTSAGNSYVSGLSNTTGADSQFGMYLAKYNTSGSIQWQRRLGGAANDVGYSVALDSDENVYLHGHHASSSTQGGNDSVLAKYSSSGSLQWIRSLGNANTNNAVASGKSVAVDSSNNIYILGTESTTRYYVLAKYNSSGIIQWQRSITPTYTRGSVVRGAIDVDSSGNIYATGAFTDSSLSNKTKNFIIKFDTNGNAVYTKEFSNSSATFAESIKVMGTALIIGGYGGEPVASPGTNTPYVMKLPLDGSLNWSLFNFYIQDSTDYTVATSSLTGYSPSLTNFNVSMTESGGIGTDGAGVDIAITTTIS
jgi:hypothetical protein